MVRFVFPIAFALLLPSCSSSDVYCSYDSGMVQVACAEFMFSGDSQGADITSLEQSACTSGGGTVVGSCPTTNTLGTCTIEASADSATFTGAEQVYAVNGLTAAEAQTNCTALNGTNGVTTAWSASCNTVADCHATCVGGSFTPAGTACNANLCAAPPPQSCAPYGCAGDACGTTCAQDSDCTVGPCNVCPPDVELCLAPLGPVASLAPGACKKVLAACTPVPRPTCGSLGSFPAGTRPTAMAFDGTNMWVVDSYGGDVIELSPAGATLGIFSVGPELMPSAIAFDGTNMWVTTDMLVVELSPAGATLGTFSLGPSTNPGAIAFDGTNMWVADAIFGMVTELSPIGTILGTFAVDDSGLQAIAFDGTNMWVTTTIMGGKPTGNVVKLSPTGAVLGTFPVGSYPYDPGAIAFDGTNMWVVDGGGGVIELSPSGSTVGTFTVGFTPQGIAFDGTNMWVFGGEVGSDNVVLGAGVAKLSPAGVTLGSFPFGVGDWPLGGIAFDGQHMWVTSSAQGNNITEL